MKKGKLLLIVTCFLCFGYSYGQNVGKILNSVTKSTGTTGEVTEEDGNVHVEGMGHKKTFNLSGGILHVEGASNQITVKGFASKIIVEGAGNIVYADKVNNVVIDGADSKVFFSTTDNKSKRPNAKVEGLNSAVIKRK